METKPKDTKVTTDVLDWLRGLGPREATVSSLIELHRANRELFFRLATTGIGADADPWAIKLAGAVSTLGKVVSRGLSFKATELALVFTGLADVLPLGATTPEDASAFLHELRGATNSERGGKDYVGQHVSQEEISFALGDPETWAADERRVHERMNAQPTILRLDDADRRAVEGGMPPYVVYGLKHSATKLVQAATVMYPGLRRDGRLKDGRAYCGQLRHMYDNSGNRVIAPQGMVYAVYVDPDNYVFDWDWVCEDPDNPGYPISPDLRFTGDPVNPVPEAVIVGVDDLVLTEFDKTKAWHSARGDCVFCYFSKEPAFAERINDDLTAFYSLVERDRPTGFKVKNAGRLLREGGRKDLDDAPGMQVTVHSFLLFTIKRDPKVMMKFYNVLIEAWFEQTAPTVTVHPPQQESLRETAANCH